MSKIVLGVIGAVVAVGGGLVIANTAMTIPTCDGTKVTKNCTKDGQKYSKYVNHAAEPEKKHTVYHPPEYGTRIVRDCKRTTIGYKNGTCALSRCRDGEYSGSTGRGTCSYHGGVAERGPWYEEREEQYLIKDGWTETIIDVPAKKAWTEKVEM